MWRRVATQFSPLSQVGAVQISTPLAYIAVRASGMKFSQQISPPTRPNGVW